MKYSYYKGKPIVLSSRLSGLFIYKIIVMWNLYCSFWLISAIKLLQITPLMLYHVHMLADLRLDNRRGWAKLCTCLMG